MQWWGPARTVEVVERPGALVFTARRHRRQGQLGLMLVCLVALVVAAYLQSEGGAYLSGFGLLALAVGWFRARDYTLEVSARWLESSNPSLSEAKRSVPWSEVVEIGFRTGGEDEQDGLAVRTGRWHWVCLLPEVNRTQCEEIESRIWRHFPDLILAEPPEPLWSVLKAGADQVFDRALGRVPERRD